MLMQTGGVLKPTTRANAVRHVNAGNHPATKSSLSRSAARNSRRIKHRRPICANRRPLSCCRKQAYATLQMPAYGLREHLTSRSRPFRTRSSTPCRCVTRTTS